MKIKEFSIIRYGPLHQAKPFVLSNFNLFWGKNEEGKTLTIEALIKLLLKKNIRDFKNIDRVEENPEGYVIIKDNKGREFKLPEQGDLTKIVGLTQSECRNIFTIRNSDLSISRESEFYTDVTDRLTGLRTEDIAKIKDALMEIGKITPGGIFRDIKEEKLKTKIENAKGLIEKIKSLVKEVKEEKFDELEEKSARHREEIDMITQKIESLENARKRERYEKGDKALNKLQGALKKLKDLEIYNEKDKQLWRDCEKDIKDLSEQKNDSVRELKRNERKLKRINEAVSRKERDFRILDGRKKKIDDEVKPELKNYEEKIGKLASQESKTRSFTSIGKTSLVLLGVSLLGAILNPSSLFYILTVLFLVPTLSSWVFKFQFGRSKARHAEAFERIKLKLSKYELGAEDVEEILSNIQKFDDAYRKKYDELQEIKRGKENLEETIKDLRDKTIPNINGKIKDAEEKIEGIKVKSGQSSLKKYLNKLKSKRETEGLAGEQESILESHLGKRGDELEENISYWNGKIKDLEEHKDKAKDLKYDEKTVLELKEKKRLFEEELNKIEEKIIHFQKDLEEIEREANKILQLEADYLHCKTSVDLKAVRDKLQGFINENENNKDAVLKVMKIFEEIEAKEKKKVSELFGKDSSISQYFKEITNGSYEEVSFSQKIGKIEVKRRNGAILDAGKLSGGTYDQLYLSIRLALGEKLLKGKKGFFIMDDPFIKADPDRLRRQIDTLKKISKLGWQVIYFSAKGEIKEVLKEDITHDAINYSEVQGITYGKEKNK